MEHEIDTAIRLSKDDEEKARKLDASNAKKKQCSDNEDALLRKTLDANREEILQLLAIDFGIVVVGWLIVWFVVAITRWMRRGRKRKQI